MTLVSDHAVVRYLERIEGVDIEAIKKKILPEHMVKMTKALGNGYYPVGDTHKIRVKDGIVVTVLDPKMKLRKKDPTRYMTTRNKALRKAELRKAKMAKARIREAEQWEEADLV